MEIKDVKLRAQGHVADLSGEPVWDDGEGKNRDEKSWRCEGPGSECSRNSGTIGLPGARALNTEMAEQVDVLKESSC